MSLIDKTADRIMIVHISISMYCFFFWLLDVKKHVLAGFDSVKANLQIHVYISRGVKLPKNGSAFTIR